MLGGVVGRIGDDVNKIIGQIDGKPVLVIGGNLVVLTKGVEDGEDALCTLSRDPGLG